MTPTIAIMPCPLGSLTFSDDEPWPDVQSWIPFTWQFNISGQPAISLPLYSTSEGLPVGIQLVGAYGRDDLVLQVAAQLEEAQPWVNRMPIIGN